MKTVEKMKDAAAHALKELFDINSDDKILILSDIHSRTVAEAFRGRM